MGSSCELNDMGNDWAARGVNRACTTKNAAAQCCLCFHDCEAKLTQPLHLAKAAPSLQPSLSCFPSWRAQSAGVACPHPQPAAHKRLMEVCSVDAAQATP